MLSAYNRDFPKQANCPICIADFQEGKHDRFDRVYVGLYDYFILTHFPRKNSTICQDKIS